MCLKKAKRSKIEKEKLKRSIKEQQTYQALNYHHDAMYTSVVFQREHRDDLYYNQVELVGE